MSHLNKNYCTLCRHQFYVNVKEQLKQGQLHGLSEEEQARAAGLIAQVELGSLSSCGLIDRTQYVNYLPITATLETRRLAARIHRTLIGLSAQDARNQLFQLVACLPTYGMDFHTARYVDTSSNEHLSRKVHVGVGPETLMIMSEDWQEIKR